MGALLPKVGSMTEVVHGLVKYWNSEKGFGFIDGATLNCNSKEDVFFHVSHKCDPKIADFGINFFSCNEPKQKLRLRKSRKISFIMEQNSKGYFASSWCYFDDYIKVATKYHSLPLLRLVQVIRAVSNPIANNERRCFESLQLDFFSVLWMGRMPRNAEISRLTHCDPGDRLPIRAFKQPKLLGGVSYLEHVGYKWQTAIKDAWQDCASPELG